MLTSGVFLSVCRQEWRAHNRYHIVVSAPALIVNLLKVLTWGPRASVPKWGALHMWACTLIRWELVQMQATEPTQRGLIRSFCSGTEDLHLWQGSQRCWDGWSRDHVWRTPGRCLRSCLLEFLLPGQSWRTRSQSLTAHGPSPSSDNSRQCDLGQSFSALSSTSENVGWEDISMAFGED